MNTRPKQPCHVQQSQCKRGDVKQETLTTHSTPAVDYRTLVSPADLIYDQPAARPVEGHPIGNGRMGTMVWTTPAAIHFQINRSDVFAVNRNHGGARGGPADYCGGCAQVTVDVGGEPFAAGPAFGQRLSLYEAEDTVVGSGVRARCFVCATADVLVVEIDDTRDVPQPVRVTLSMWREPEVLSGDHLAKYSWAEADDKSLPCSGYRVTVAQHFSEKDHYCSSAVTAGIVAEQASVESTGPGARTITVPGCRGKRLILISSAASWERGKDAAVEALAAWDWAADRGAAAVRGEHANWWSDLWSRTFVRLTSADGRAEQIARIRYLQLYYMASSSRGDLPPKWNGSIFAVDGDARSWGAQFWVWTTEASCFPLYAADAIELTDSFFDMYVKQLEGARMAARQRWNAEGAYFLEAGPFDGPVVLPEDIAKEYQDVYLGRKTVNDLSDAARDLGQYECVLTQFADGHDFRGVAGRYSFVSHIAHSGSQIAAQAWRRYRYTGDVAWLRAVAYPLLRETVEFYRTLARKGDDGLYHLYGLNQFEGGYGTNDGTIDLGAIRGTAPLAIRAAEILEVDVDLRAKWREFADKLTPYTMSSDPRTYGVVKDCEVDVWAYGIPGDVPHERYVDELHEKILYPVFPFENWTLETADPALDRIVRTLAGLNMFHTGLVKGRWNEQGMNAHLNTPAIDARLGMGDSLPTVLINHLRQYHPLPNGFSLFEGPTDHSIEHLGDISTAIGEALLQSVSPRPGEPEIISVFPAWPREWDAEFRCLARGGFLVSAAIKGGEIETIEIFSRRGETCRIRNCWDGTCVLRETGGAEQYLDGGVLIFETRPDITYRVERHQ